MNGNGFRPGRLTPELESLIGGRLAAAIALFRHALPDERALVRPVVDDSVADWILGLDEALGTRGGDTVAFVGDDVLLAAALACDAAAWLGDKGTRVTLIDGSLERPSIEKALREDGEEGLVDATRFGVSPASVARRTLASAVRLVTSGSAPVSGDAVFEGEAVRDVLAAFGASSDLVLLVLEAASVGAARRLADVVVLVATTTAELDGLAEGVAPGERCRRVVGVLVTVEETPPVGERDLEPAAGPTTGEEEAAREGGPRIRTPSKAETEAEGARPAEPLPEPEATPEAGEQETEEAPAAVPQEAEMAPEPAGVAVYDGSRPRRGVPRWAMIAGGIVVLGAAGFWIWHGLLRPLDDVARSRDARESVVTERDAMRPTAEAAEEIEDAAATAAGGEPAGLEERERIGDDAGADARSPEAAPPTPTVEPAREERRTAPPAAGRSYTVFVSSHKHRSAARRDSARLERDGMQAAIVEVELGDAGRWFRVGVRSTYPGVGEARQMLDIVKQFGYDGAWIERTSNR